MSPFLALRLGKSQGGSSLTIGSAFVWFSNIAMKYLLILFNHDIECTYTTDEGQNLIFTEHPKVHTEGSYQVGANTKFRTSP